MRLKLLISTALCAGILAGCSQSGPSQSVSYTDGAIAETAGPGNAERYARNDISPIRAVADTPVSTFAVDVDTAAYANVRRFLTAGAMPPEDAVRSEELINYFRYDYPLPADRGAPFSVTTDVARTPWNPETRLLRVGLRGYDLGEAQRPPANLVFLVDVSGSMADADKLPLVKSALSMLADNLRPQDRVSIVVYAGAAGLALEPTSDPAKVKAALGQLSAGGSTAGGEGIELAYATARAGRIAGGINRVILATDGDFNVGVTDQGALEALIEKNRDDGITLTALGFGEGNLNDAMMESVADKGNGNYAYVDSAMEARKVLDEELSSTLFTIASDVKVQVEFNPAQVSEYRLIGYENRALREEDFHNDKVDAGDIGAGHQVTALYEIVPVGAKGWLGPRRFEGNKRAAAPAGGDEIAFVKLRYKLPGQDRSRLIERPVPGALLRAAAAPAGDMAFAVAVAGFAQKLRGDKLLAGWGYADVRRLAGDQPGYWRQEFVKLVGLAESGSRTARAEDAAGPLPL
ncbi:MAG: VWA domain-containing protein [Sphingomonas sp.]